MFGSNTTQQKYQGARPGLKGAVSAFALALALSNFSAVPAAMAASYNISIQSQSLHDAILDLSRQTNVTIFVDGNLVDGRIAPQVTDAASLEGALGQLLSASNLTYTRSDNGVYAIIERTGFQAIALTSDAGYEARLNESVEEEEAEREREETETVGFEEIVVTATRRATGIQSTAMSISAIGGDELEKAGYNSISQFVDMVPGVTGISEGPGANRIIIRNVATSTQEGGSAIIATYFDDFAIAEGGFASSGAADIRLVDMERVEVLKGPQGTLYGRSAMGGVVRYISNKPNVDKIEGGINVYGSDVTDGGTNFGGHGYLNLPITDTLAIRAVGYYYNNDGFIDNVELGVKDFNDEETKGGRIAVHWDATENFTVDLTYLNQTMNGAMNWVTTTRDPGDLNIAGDEGPEIPFDLNARNQVAGILMENETKHQIMNLKLEYDFDSFVATILATRVKLDASFTFDQREFVGIISGCTCDFLEPGNEPAGKEVDTLEFRLVSSGDGDQFVDWIFGAYYEDSDEEWAQTIRQLGPDQLIFGFLPVASGEVLIDSIGEITSSEKAVYGELGFNITPETNLTVGYRRSHVEFGTLSKKADGLFLAFSGANLLVDIPFDTKENVSTYKISLEHSFNDDIFGYATATSGYRRGGFNQPTLNSGFSEFGSDTLWNYEVGLKTTWLDGRLVANVSAYMIDYTGIQLTIQDPVTFVRATQNAGDARISGVEALIAFQVNDYLDLSFSGSVSSSKMQEDVPDTGFGVPGSGINKGDRLPGSAKENFAIQANWNQPLSDAFDAFASLTYKYSGSRNNDFNLVRDDAVLGSYQMVDARLGVRSEDGYSISLFAHNLFDEKVAFVIDRQGATFESVPTNRPRTVGLNVTYDF